MDIDTHLASYKAVREIMERHGLRARKNFGQNFLIDPRVLAKIVQAADVNKNDLVIEIGPGLGVLTAALAGQAGRVIAVEIDSTLLPVLHENLADADNVTIINEDILKVDIKRLIEQSGFKSAKIAANLPYYITTPIIFAVLESGAAVQSITVMVQKEVGARMAAGPGSKVYGALSLAVSYYADVYLAANVPPNCFFPRPDVDSAVIRLDVLPEPRVKVDDSKRLFALIKAGFAMRRKTLQNCLSASDELNLTKEQAAAAIECAGLPPSVRGEALTLEDYARLLDCIDSRS